MVTSPSPKMSSSATRPPMQTSSLASSWRLLMLVSSASSGSCITIPSAMPARSHACWDEVPAAANPLLSTMRPNPTAMHSQLVCTLIRMALDPLYKGIP